MLTPPSIPVQTILDCLTREYALIVESLTFLPLGADLNTAVYRVDTPTHASFFLKLRSGQFFPASVAVPNYLSRLGLRQVIPAINTISGDLSASLPPFTVILYPYVEGLHGFDRYLSDSQWREFGAALKTLHTARIPAALTADLPRESFSPHWRDTLSGFLAHLKQRTFPDPVARGLAVFLQLKTPETLALIRHAGHLARLIQPRSIEFNLCHADIHAWNLLVTADGPFYIVDWDTLIFAPRERDLMFIGCGLGGNGHSPAEEESLFYQGYGSTRPDPLTISYYRCERVIEDIAVYCQQLFLSNAGGADRLQALEYCKSNYLPGGAIERALSFSAQFDE